MKNLLKLSGLSILILTILMSCNKSEDDFIVSEPQSYNSNVEKIAKATSLALQEEDFRTFVYEESMKMFDGETNFLIKDVLKHSFDDGLTFEQKLSKEFSSIETFKNFINDNPKLQIAIPVHIGKWNIESYIPEVVFY